MLVRQATAADVFATDHGALSLGLLINCGQTIKKFIVFKLLRQRQAFPIRQIYSFAFMAIVLYLVRRGIQCSAAILPSMPTLASWSQNWSLSSSCSSLISSSSREATPLAVWCYFNKSTSNQLMLCSLRIITTGLLYVILGFVSHKCNRLTLN